MAKNTKPTIRFKGFTDAWEQRKLGEVIRLNGRIGFRGYTEKDIITKEEGGILTFSPTNIVDNKLTTRCKNTYITRFKYDESPEIKVHNGDILFVKTGSTLGKSALISGLSEEATLNPQVVVMRTPSGEEEFLSSVLITENISAQVTASKIGGAVPTLTETKIKDFDIAIPKTKEERKQIGSYFNSLDHLITLHQRKYDSLVNVKKAMLEKMFPKNGETVPEIRFKGFTDAWEQRKLSGIYQNIGNAFVGTATPYYVEDGHFYLESNNIKDGQINRNSEIFINDEFYEKQKDKWLHTGDMVMVQSGHVGHAAVIPEELDNSAAHALIMFRNQKEKVNPYFLNYQYQTNKAKKKIEGITTGNTIKHILASDMQEFVVDVPDFEEQEIIGAYFQQLDNLITLHQRKLEKLKNIKKSCLEKMFV
ncbi:restriction endonuclease subunit S [Phascolarctobacterium succinatutens]|uniref:restriction endonuclease subunit S n=1 Tax=Phascolarctobacterium succinatutens TaxID=626940 RepID=UPI00307B44D6